MSGFGPVSDEGFGGQLTPISDALQRRRNGRQEQIRDYQEAFDCRLVVLLGELGPYSVELFEETLFGADPGRDLHVHAREVTVIVPDQAKSAGTLFVLGTHHILMGPTSDLGPVDPQLHMPDGTLVAAKTIIAAVEHAEEQVRTHSQTFELHAFLLADVNGLQVQEAREAIGRSNALVREALASCPGRDDAEVELMAQEVSPRLIDEPQSHLATISARDAEQLSMPVIHADPSGDQWKRVWRLWAEYFAIPETCVYEGEIASYVFN